MAQRLTDRERLLRSITEAEWQRTVIAYAKARGWRVAHFPRSYVGGKPMTAVTVDGAGWPDLTMVRDGRIVFAELKTEQGRVSPEQTTWISDLMRVQARSGGLSVVIWRPSDQDEMEEVLK